MKMLLASILAVAALAVASAPAAASAKSPLEGRWKNGAMEIVIGPCGQKLCGTVVKASPVQRARAERGSGTDLVGAQADPGTSSRPARAPIAGDVFVADRNVHAQRHHPGRFRPASCSVRGCVRGVSSAGRSTWERVRLGAEEILSQGLPELSGKHRRLKRLPCRPPNSGRTLKCGVSSRTFAECTSCSFGDVFSGA
jgi:hypothetical protein